MADSEASTKKKLRKRSSGGKDQDAPKKSKIKRKDKNKKAKSEGNIALDPAKQEEFEEKLGEMSGEGSEELTPGVIYVGHLPHGFYEQELKGFFSQFGTVKRIKVPRSRKTARPHGYAYIEFACDEVAKIAASAMDNYLMFDKLLKCRFLPAEKVGKDTFKNAGRKFAKIDWNAKARRKHNKIKSKKEISKQIQHLASRDNKKRQKLKELGIDYTFPGYVGVKSKSATEDAIDKSETVKSPVVTDEGATSHDNTNSNEERKAVD